MSIFNHVGTYVSDLDAARRWYGAALAPLGITELAYFPDYHYAGMGAERPEFWFGQSYEGHPISKGVHLAFTAKNRAAVDAFYEAAIAGGGTDNGKPGLRPEYSPDYYGAFVLDLDGNNVEAVTHSAE